MEYSNNSEAEVKESNLYNLNSVNSKLFTLLLIFTLFHSTAYAKSFGDYEGAIYVRNYDGDTITFNLNRIKFGDSGTFPRKTNPYYSGSVFSRG